MLDYWIFQIIILPILTEVLTGNYWLLLLCLGCAFSQRSIPFGYLFSFTGLGSSGSSAVFIAEEVEGVGDKGSGNTTIVDVQTLLEDFLNMSVSFMKIFLL